MISTEYTRRQAALRKVARDARLKAEATVKQSVDRRQNEALQQTWEQIKDSPRLCEAWKDFEKFATWSRISGFEKGRTLVRKNPRGKWHPLNCEWRKTDG